VAEAAVGVAERGDGGAHRARLAVAEEPLEAAAVEDAPVRGQEALGGVEVR
jgi:hypothetical protein